VNAQLEPDRIDITLCLRALDRFVDDPRDLLARPEDVDEIDLIVDLGQ
jgi:hypothetical protein